jgi:hypothetical protein
MGSNALRKLRSGDMGSKSYGMEIEKLIPPFVKSPSYNVLLSSGQATLSEILSQPLTFRLFSQKDPLIID